MLYPCVLTPFLITQVSDMHINLNIKQPSVTTRTVCFRVTDEEFTQLTDLATHYDVTKSLLIKELLKAAHREIT